MQVHVDEDPAAVAARWMAGKIRRAIARTGSAAVAVSGGGTAPPLFEALITHDLAWESVTVWQVDERVAPDGDPGRNAGQLHVLPCAVRPMPVTAADLRAAARRYANGLPDRFDVVHLGLGDDGHTASWPPGDRSVVASDRDVEVVDTFNGYQRMTLTPRVVNAAAARAMFTVGASKAPLLRAWIEGDRSLPVSHVRRTGTECFVDPPAAP